MSILKDFWEFITGEKARRKREEKFRADLIVHDKNVEDSISKFVDVVGHGTDEYDLLVIEGEVSEVTDKYTLTGGVGHKFKMVYVCGKNAPESVIGPYDIYESRPGMKWPALNLWTDKFDIIFKLNFADEDKRVLSQYSIITNHLPEIYLHDFTDVRLNDPDDIHDLLEILEKRIRFFNGGIKHIVNGMKSKL